MSEAEETCRIEHRPDLKWPYQVQVKRGRRKRKWVTLESRQTLAAAEKIVARLRADRSSYGEKT